MSNTFRYLFLILRNKFLLDLLKIYLYFLQNHKIYIEKETIEFKDSRTRTKADVTIRNTLCVSSVQEQRRRFALSILVHQQRRCAPGLFLRIGRRLQSARVRPDVGRAVVFMTVKSYVDQDDDENDGRMAKRRTMTNANERINGIYGDAKRRVVTSSLPYRLFLRLIYIDGL